ncbi:unnamed protein product [Lymnaea stagnalis]|uniref:Protein kinase domain-containing protein n=1 Tax=Lymnaea stagnalis TaxID=6523 RepID=A0AAV2IJE5_LYMST
MASETHGESDQQFNFAIVFYGDGVTPPTNCRIGDCIGSGGFGKVYLMTAVDKMLNKELVAKQVSLTSYGNENTMKSFEVEIKLLASFRHERIVPYHGFCKTQNTLSLFIERIPMGSLDDYLILESNPDLTESEMQDITKQILEGLQYLHCKKIIHRDIKGANVLLEEKFIIKLADFGVSKTLEETSMATTANAGTVRWMAPEMFIPQRYGVLVDIWAVACTLIQMINRAPPFNDLRETHLVIVRLMSPNPSPAYNLKTKGSKHREDFLRVTLEKNSAQRPNASQLLGNHPFVASLKSDDTSTDNHSMSLTELIKYNKSCDTNPGHRLFVPIKYFNINHLPLGYHDNDAVELVKAVANITVRVCVQNVSFERPNFTADTYGPYPFSDRRGSIATRTGTGYVYRIDRKRDTCCICTQCKKADTPSNHWGEIWVVTATKVVFDNQEARRTTCRIFYDEINSPFKKNLLEDFSVEEANIETDRCVIKCATCDPEILDNVSSLLRQAEICRSSLVEKYIGREEEPILAIIVSHPHGCTKQVTVGEWRERREKRELGADLTHYTYTASTCPGSEGAPVVMLSRINHMAYHTHSGTNADGFGYSGFWNG